MDRSESLWHTHSKQFTALVSLSWAVTWSSAWMAWSAWHVFCSCSCYQGNPRCLTLSTSAWHHACTAHSPALSVLLELLPSVCLYSQVLFFFSLSHACFLPLAFVSWLLIADGHSLTWLFWWHSSVAGWGIPKDAPTGPRHLWKPCCQMSHAGTRVPWCWRPGGQGFPDVGDLEIRGVPDVGDLGVGGSLMLETMVSPCCPTLPCGPHTETASQTGPSWQHSLHWMLFGHVETQWPLSKHLEHIACCGSALGCSLCYRHEVNPRYLLSFPEACQRYWWTQIISQSWILSISHPYFWPFHWSEMISSHTRVWLMLSMSFLSTEIRMSKIHTFVTGTSLLLPPLMMRGVLSYTCTVCCLRVRLSISSLFLVVLMRGYTHHSPGPQVLFSSCSLFPQLGRSLVCHVLNCHWQAGLAVVKRNRLNCHLGEFTVSTHYARTNWSSSEKKEKKKTGKKIASSLSPDLSNCLHQLLASVYSNMNQTPPKSRIWREKKVAKHQLKKTCPFDIEGDITLHPLNSCFNQHSWLCLNVNFLSLSFLWCKNLNSKSVSMWFYTVFLSDMIQTFVVD